MLDVTVKVIKKAPSENLKKSKVICPKSLKTKAFSMAIDPFRHLFPHRPRNIRNKIEINTQSYYAL